MFESVNMTSGTTSEVDPLETEAEEVGEELKGIMKETREAKARLKLMKKMKIEGKGFNIKESFLNKLTMNKRALVNKGKQGRKEGIVLKAIMTGRVLDQSDRIKELNERKWEMRNELEIWKRQHES